MINDNTIISSFNDRPSLLEWLKKVEEALKSDTATGVSVENPSVNSYIFKITFADGKTIASDTIRFPDSVKGASISNNHLILTMQTGVTDDLGVINPYAETIVNNTDTGTTEIRNNAYLGGNLQVHGNVSFDNSIISIGGTTKQNGILGTNEDGKIAFKEVTGGTQWYEHKLVTNSGSGIRFVLPFEKNLLEIADMPFYEYVFGIVLRFNGPSVGDINPSSTFANLEFAGQFIYCSTVKSDGTLARSTIDIKNYNQDIVTKYQVAF